MRGAAAEARRARLSRRRARGRRSPASRGDAGAHLIARDDRARRPRSPRPACVISSGETTVTVDGEGTRRPQSGVRAGLRRRRSPARRRRWRWRASAPMASTGRPTRPARSSTRRRSARARRAPAFPPSTAYLRQQRLLLIFRRGSAISSAPARPARTSATSRCLLLSRRNIQYTCCHATRSSRRCASGCTIPPARANCSNCSRFRARSAPRSSVISRRWSPSGELIQIRGQRFGLPEKMDLYVGRARNASGRLRLRRAGAAARTAAATSTSPAPHLSEAMHGDRVVARIERIKDGGRAEGRIIRILERAQQLARRPLRPRRGRHGLRRAVRSPRADGHPRSGRARRAARRRARWSPSS